MSDFYFLKAGHCTRCQQPLASSAFMVKEKIAWRVIGSGADALALTQKQLAPVCEACPTPKEAAAGIHTITCPGCDITFKHNGRWGRRCCSEACAKRYLRRRKQDCKPERQCAVCKLMFKPARSDAEYCSGACRQWAFRRRSVTGNGNGPVSTYRVENRDVTSLPR